MRLKGQYYLVDKAWLGTWRRYMDDFDQQQLTMPDASRFVCQHAKSVPPNSLVALLDAPTSSMQELEQHVDDVEFVDESLFDRVLRSCENVDALDPTVGSADSVEPDSLRRNLVTVKFDIAGPGGRNNWRCFPELCTQCVGDNEKAQQVQDIKFDNAQIAVRLLKAGDNPEEESKTPVKATALSSAGRPMRRRRTTRSQAKLHRVTLSHNDSVMLAKLKCVQAIGSEQDATRVQLYFNGQKLHNETTLEQVG